MAEGIGWLVAFFRRTEPREPAPSGWALAFERRVAVGAAAGAVYEMAERAITQAVVFPAVPGPIGLVGPARVAGGAALAASPRRTRPSPRSSRPR